MAKKKTFPASGIKNSLSTPGRKLFTPGLNLTQKIHQLQGLDKNTPGPQTQGLQNKILELQKRKRMKQNQIGPNSGNGGGSNNNHKQNAGGGKANSGGGKTKKSSSSSSTDSSSSSFDITKALGPDDIKKYLEAAVRLQTQPAIDSANSEIGSQTRLGEQATGNISSYYRSLASAEAGNLAKTQALGGRLRDSVASSNTEGAQTTQRAADAATGAVGASDALRGPSSAREELAQMVAAQQARQAASASTMNNAASGQAADYEATSGLMAQANQMHGASQVSDVQRGVANNVAAALAKKQAAEASRGDLAYTTLNDIRKQERDFQLSQGALGIKGATLQNAAQQKAADRKAAANLAGKKQKGTIKGQKLKGAQAVGLQQLKGQQASQLEGQKQSGRVQLAYIRSNASKAGKGVGAIAKKEWPQAKANFATTVAKLTVKPKDFLPADWADFTKTIAGEGVSPSTAQKFVQQYRKHVEKKNNQLSSPYAGAKAKGKVKAGK